MTVEILSTDGGVIDPTITFTELVWYGSNLPLWTLADATETGTEKYIYLANDAVSPAQIQTDVGSFLLDPAQRKYAHLVFIDDVWKDLKYQYDYGTWFVDRFQEVFQSGVENLRFGRDVALSADGNTLAVTADFSSLTDPVFGAVIFVRDVTTGIWTQQSGVLMGSGFIDGSIAAIDKVGVAISADGNTMAYGYPADNANVGATWVFFRTGTTWAQQSGKLVGSGATGAARQGTDVALDASGDTLVVGGPTNAVSVGAAWVFVRSAGVWSQQGAGPLTIADGGLLCSIGFAVTLSSDGNTAILGAPSSTFFATCAGGSFFVVTRTGTTWTQDGARVDNPGAGATFGSDVSLAGSGITVGVGCSQCSGGISPIGAVYTYVRLASGTWSQLGPALFPQTEVPEAESGGGRLALSKDGFTLATGYEWAFSGFPVVQQPVLVWLRTLNGADSGWSLVGTPLLPTDPDVLFGRSVALDADARTLATSGSISPSILPTDNSVYVFI